MLKDPRVRLQPSRSGLTLIFLRLSLARSMLDGNWIGSVRFMPSIVGAERAVAKNGDEVEVCERRAWRT